MCAEAGPEKCHRQLIADALVLLKMRIPGKPATESGGNRPGRSEATLEVDNYDRGGRFESIRMTLLG